MKTGWICTTLQEVATVDYGTRVVQKRDGGIQYPVYGGGGATFSVDRTNRADCFIVSRFGISAECVRYVSGEFFLNDSGLTVSSKNPEFLSQKFLDYQLLANQPTIYSLARGTAQKNLDVDAFRAMQINVPNSLDEQWRIVAVLDKAFAGIATATANAQKNLTNARALFSSYLETSLQDEVGDWLEKPFGECFRLKSGDGLTSSAMIDGPFPVFGGNGIAGYHNESNLPADNVIIGRVGALCGNARHVKEPIWLTDNAFKVTENRFNIDNSFLTYLLNFLDLRSFARQTAQPVISNSSLKDVAIRFPSSKERQQEIVRSLDALSAKCEELSDSSNHKLAALSELKQSLLEKAFAGELT